MDDQKVLEIVNAIDLKLWIFLLKFGFVTLVFMIGKGFIEHLYNYLALRISSGYGVNTKILYEGELYYFDEIKFTSVILIKKNKRIFIPINLFMESAIVVVRNGDPDSDK
jgi:hypothetical protein